MRCLAFLASVGLFCGLAAAQSERDYQSWLCSGRAQEAAAELRTRVDCVMGNSIAVEVDWSHKWAEGIGQALFYASSLDMRPGLILICQEGTSDASCLRHSLAARQTISSWTLPFILWECSHTARELADCERSEW